MKTWQEPLLPAGQRAVHVRPGGLRAALSAAKPGDTLLLHKGTYNGTFQPPSGLPGKPIALVGAGDGEAVLDARGAGNVLDGSGRHDIMLERLTFQNARWALAFNGGARITLRRCIIRDADYGFVAQRDSRKQQRIYIADNVFRGRSSWPRTKGIESRRGIQVSGTGHVVCYNRISHYADGIDTLLFASGIRPPADPKTQFDLKVNDLRLRPGSQAVDAGAPLPNINDGFAGKAPDLGAYELGQPLPHYGPRK